MAKFVINEGSTSHQRVVVADYFQTAGDFIDFSDHEEGVVFRIAANLVKTINRERESR